MTQKKRSGKARQTLIQRSRAIAPSAKATFHQVAGAGKRRIKRPFFGLTADDKAAILARLREGIQNGLRAR